MRPAAPSSYPEYANHFLLVLFSLVRLEKHRTVPRICEKKKKKIPRRRNNARLNVINTREKFLKSLILQSGPIISLKKSIFNGVHA